MKNKFLKLKRKLIKESLFSNFDQFERCEEFSTTQRGRILQKFTIGKKMSLFKSKITEKSLKSKKILYEKEDLEELKKQGYTLEEIEKWKEYGFTPEEMIKWVKLSKLYPLFDDPALAAEWRDYGFTPEELKKWLIFNFEPYDVARWVEANFTVDEAIEWSYHKFMPREAKKWRDAGFTPEEAEKLREKGYTPEKAKNEIQKEEKTKNENYITEKLLKLKKSIYEQTEDDTFQKWANYVSKKLTEWNLNLTIENIRRILSLTKFGRDLYEKSPAKFERFVKKIYDILSGKKKLTEKLSKLKRLLKESELKEKIKTYREYMKTPKGQELKRIWQKAKDYSFPETSSWRTPYLLFIGMALEEGFTKDDIFEFLSAFEYWKESEFEELWQTYKKGYLK